MSNPAYLRPCAAAELCGSAKASLAVVDYTQEIGSTICDRLFDGETLSEICRDPAMPDKPTVMRWLAKYPSFLAEYRFTRQLRMEDLAVEALSIVDSAASLKQIRAALARLKRKEVSCVK
jgi:hypothetical protein